MIAGKPGTISMQFKHNFNAFVLQNGGAASSRPSKEGRRHSAANPFLDSILQKAKRTFKSCLNGI